MVLGYYAWWGKQFTGVTTFVPLISTATVNGSMSLLFSFFNFFIKVFIVNLL